MITLVYPVHPSEDYRLDLSCPVILCDACGKIVDADHPGNLLWRSSDDRDAWHAHKGICGRAVEKAVGEHLLWRGLSVWLAQLVRNYEDPLVGSEVEVGSGKVFPVAEVATQQARP